MGYNLGPKILVFVLFHLVRKTSPINQMYLAQGLPKVGLIVYSSTYEERKLDILGSLGHKACSSIQIVIYTAWSS